MVRGREGAEDRLPPLREEVGDVHRADVNAGPGAAQEPEAGRVARLGEEEAPGRRQEARPARDDATARAIDRDAEREPRREEAEDADREHPRERDLLRRALVVVAAAAVVVVVAQLRIRPFPLHHNDERRPAEGHAREEPAHGQRGGEHDATRRVRWHGGSTRRGLL